MGKVKVRDRAPGPNRKMELWGVIYKLDIRVAKISEANGGYFMLADDETIEKINEKASEFRKSNYDILDPPELKAKRTVVLTGVCEHIPQYNDQDIIEGVSRANPTLRATDVIRIPRNDSVLKLKLENVSMVSHCLRLGISLYSQHFSDYFVSQDFYAHIPQCMRCYSYEHTSKNCDRPETYCICSICSEEGHRYNECSNARALCLSCRGNHATMAARCPTRKEKSRNLAKEKRAQSVHRTPTNNGPTYAAATASSALPSNFNPQPSAAWTAPPLEQTAIINTALIYSNMRETAKPGVFQHTFNRIMEANGLPCGLNPLWVEFRGLNPVWAESHVG